MTELKGISLKIRELFREVFTTNCSIEDSTMTNEESDTIEEISINEVIENLKNIIFELLAFKKRYICSNKAELVQRNEQFESMLQKLEAEIRGHIRIEHQLKLFIETNQSHTSDLEAKSNKSQLEIKGLQEKVKNSNKSKDFKEFVEKVEKLEGIIKKKDLTIARMENEINELRMTLQSQESDREKFVIAKNRKKSEGVEEIKQRFDEKAVGLHKLQNFIRDASAKHKNKAVRGSMNVEGEGLKHKVLDVKAMQKYVTKAHNRSSSQQARPKSAKKRSPSR